MKKLKETPNMMSITRTEVILTYLKRYIAEFWSDEVASTTELQVRNMVERMGKQIVLSVDLPMEPLETYRELCIFKTPKTWFDFFRLEYFPNFLTERYPIEWHTERQQIEVKCGAVYPKLKEALPKTWGGEIRFSYTSRPPISAYPIMEEVED